MRCGHCTRRADGVSWLSCLMGEILCLVNEFLIFDLRASILKNAPILGVFAGPSGAVEGGPPAKK